eukprot:2178910-Rhodomonas_salina.2
MEPVSASAGHTGSTAPSDAVSTKLTLIPASATIAAPLSEPASVSVGAVGVVSTGALVVGASLVDAACGTRACVVWSEGMTAAVVVEGVRAALVSDESAVSSVVADAIASAAAVVGAGGGVCSDGVTLVDTMSA